MYILIKARHTDYKGLKRGQVFTSIPEIQEACSWYVVYRKETPSKDQIYKILEWLRSPNGKNPRNSCESDYESDTNATMITTARTTRGMIVNIDNYNVYQDLKFYESDTESEDEIPTKEKRKKSPADTINKNVKNVKNDKKYICAFFEQLWSLYPVKKGKGSISDTQKQKLFKIGIDELTRAINRYISEQQEHGTDIKYYKHGSTFFNSGYVDYLDDNYKPLPKTKKGNNNFEEREDIDFDEFEAEALKRRLNNG